MLKANIREDRLLPHLAALYLLLTRPGSAAGRRKRRTRRGAEIPARDRAPDVISYLRQRQITLTYHARTGALEAATPDAAAVVIELAS